MIIAKETFFSLQEKQIAETFTFKKYQCIDCCYYVHKKKIVFDDGKIRDQSKCQNRVRFEKERDTTLSP